MTFEWNTDKDQLNRESHGLSFERAQQAFFDPHRVVLEDGKRIYYGEKT